MDRKQIKKATEEELNARLEELNAIMISYDNYAKIVCEKLAEGKSNAQDYELQLDFCEYNKQLCREEANRIYRRLAKLRAKNNKFRKFSFNKNKENEASESEQEKQ